MDQLTAGFQQLLAPFAPCFRPEVFATFCLMTPAWIVCLGRRTISRLWETTGRSADHSHYPAFRLFSNAAWNFDEVCRILLVQLLAVFVPGSRVWLVIDDTLCHKRGAKVAFGGIFLDAVLSSKKHKVFRFGTNWVTLGLVVQLPFRTDRFFCLNILWRVYTKKSKSTKSKGSRCQRPSSGHRTKPQLAREMIEVIAAWLPGRQLVVVGDCNYLGKQLLKRLPDNVAAIGPIHWKASLTEVLAADRPGRRKKGKTLTTPKEAMDDARWAWQELRLHHPRGHKELQVKVVGPCCWYASVGARPLRVVLVRDPQGKWRNEALLSTDLELSTEEVIVGYLRRWSVEVAYCDAKQMLGFHEPMVWCAASVQRAHPMAWLVGSLVVLWYTTMGQQEPAARRQRPWYKHKKEPTFADMLACCRLHLWKNWLGDGRKHSREKWEWLLEYLATAA